jgi:hypothetical protein
MRHYLQVASYFVFVITKLSFYDLSSTCSDGERKARRYLLGVWFRVAREPIVYEPDTR